MPIRPITRRAIRSQAGNSLIEILIVVLIVGLMAAALMTSLMKKTAQMEPAASGEGDTQVMAELLARWTETDGGARESPDKGDETGDELSDAQDHDTNPLEGDAERQAYQAMLDELERNGKLERWREFLRRRLSADHALLVAMEPPDEDVPDIGPAGPVEIRWADDATATADATAGEGDPEIRWADGEPVRFVDEHD